MIWIDPAVQAQDRLHLSHVTRISDASSFDEICVNCGHTDSPSSWGRLAYPCPNEPEQHRVARMLDASNEFIMSTRGGAGE
jgi:hypothetical protein